MAVRARAVIQRPGNAAPVTAVELKAAANLGGFMAMICYTVCSMIVLLILFEFNSPRGSGL